MSPNEHPVEDSVVIDGWIYEIQDGQPTGRTDIDYDEETEETEQEAEPA